ncbi:hypothetical protein Tco_0873806 [Tanacetum coccineum]|uniref:Uncharacterized protein n=1 Tax=Tanacetum coccineum TaxID=301880 RepID=A0ABQ5BJU8_9ASTR
MKRASAPPPTTKKPNALLSPRALRSPKVLLGHLSIIIHNEDGNPSRANIKQALGSTCEGSTMDLTCDEMERNDECDSCESNLFQEILLKMNLPDHRSVLTDPEDQAKMEMETPRSSEVNSPPNAHT